MKDEKDVYSVLDRDTGNELYQSATDPIVGCHRSTEVALLNEEYNRHQREYAH